MITSFIFALFATLGFSIIFHVPYRHIPVAALIGGLGWVTYQLCISQSSSVMFSCFLAACAVGFLSDIASRILKDAATVFIIPGILCLVPGSGIYNTMVELVDGRLDQAAKLGSQTLMMAGSIALGLLVIGAMIKIIVAVMRRAKNIARKL